MQKDSQFKWKGVRKEKKTKWRILSEKKSVQEKDRKEPAKERELQPAAEVRNHFERQS